MADAQPAGTVVVTQVASMSAGTDSTAYIYLICTPNRTRAARVMVKRNGDYSLDVLTPAEKE